MAYGQQIDRSFYTPLRSVVGDVEVAPGGNIILRVGREHDRTNDSGVWEQTEHVVLTPDEAVNLAHHILAAVDA